MKILHLTLPEGRPLHVNVDEISYFRVDPFERSQTMLVLRGGEELFVQESTQEILNRLFPDPYPDL